MLLQDRRDARTTLLLFPMLLRLPCVSGLLKAVAGGGLKLL